MSLNELPLEILFKICRYLDIPDILRLRRVSRYLNIASRCKAIWTRAYLEADFVRPPGPLPSHSASDLENMLIRGFSMDQILRNGNNATRPRKLIKIPFTCSMAHVYLVFGRFLLMASYHEIRCHDLDSFNINSDGRVIYRPTTGTILSFHVSSTTDVSGHPFACVVVQEGVRTERRSQFLIHSLNVTEQSEVVLDLLHKVEQDFTTFYVELGPRVIIITGCLISGRYILVALDIHSRTPLLLPSLNAEWEIGGTQDWWSLHSQIKSTSTHIILTRAAADGSATLYEALPLPLLESQAPPAPLKCSHRGVFPIGAPLVILHSMHVPSTQDLIVTLRVGNGGWDCYHSQCGMLRFHKPRHGDVGALTFQPFDASDSDDRFTLTRSPFNGTRRTINEYGGVTSSEYPCKYDVAEYAVLSNGNEIKTREYPAGLQFPPGYYLAAYDLYRGRICFEHYARRRKWIEVWDLQRKDKPKMDVWKERLKLAKTKICMALSKVYGHS